MRYWLGILIAGMALTLASSAPRAAEVIGRGDFLFYLDTAAFLGRDGRLLEEVYVSIPNSEIKFVEADGQWKARLRLTVLIEDADGKAIIQDAQEMEFIEDAVERLDDPRFSQTVIKRYRIDAGTYDLHYAVEDLQAPKMTLLGMMHDRNQISSVRRFRLVLPEIPVDQASFSQAKFLWSGERVVTGGEYVPNPAHLYGLYRDTLAVYLELYLPLEMASAEEFEFRSQVVTGGGDMLVDRRAALGNPGKVMDEGGLRAYPVLIREDLAQVPAGAYTLYLSFSLGGHLLHRARCGTFSVAWDMRTWVAPRRAYLAEARFLLGDKEYAAFESLDLGEQERQLEAMWRANDPTPETETNEAYEEFQVRLAYINTHYTDFGAGILSPRGRIYARFGPPDEIVQDYIPINRETITEALEVVDDAYHTIDMSGHSTREFSAPAPGHSAPPPLSNTVDPRGIAGQRGGDHEAFPFELWIYTASGQPILERDRVQEMQIGMRYLFVDRDGYGRYKLESSSSVSSK